MYLSEHIFDYSVYFFAYHFDLLFELPLMCDCSGAQTSQKSSPLSTELICLFQ